MCSTPDNAIILIVFYDWRGLKYFRLIVRGVAFVIMGQLTTSSEYRILY